MKWVIAGAVVTLAAYTMYPKRMWWRIAFIGFMFVMLLPLWLKP